MPTDGLRELYIDELKDLHNAENQLVKALPKMAKASSSEETATRLRGTPGTDEGACATD